MDSPKSTPELEDLEGEDRVPKPDAVKVTALSGVDETLALQLLFSNVLGSSGQAA
jgi:hypothetical protein